MAWDPAVLRKYNTTGHFRLLNQLRSELKSNPLVRPKDGERIADVNRSRSLLRAIEGAAGSSRARRGASRRAPSSLSVLEDQSLNNDIEIDGQNSDRFRDRLDAIELR